MAYIIKTEVLNSRFLKKYVNKIKSYDLCLKVHNQNLSFYKADYKKIQK